MLLPSAILHLRKCQSIKVFHLRYKNEELIRDLCQHFPELIKIVSDNYTYAKLALFIGPKERLSDTDLHELAAHLNEDTEIAQSIIDVAKVSMGQAVNLPPVSEM